MNHSFFFSSPAAGQSPATKRPAAFAKVRAALAYPSAHLEQWLPLAEYLPAHRGEGFNAFAGWQAMLAAGHRSDAAGHLSRKERRTGSVKRLAAALNGFADLEKRHAGDEERNASNLQRHARVKDTILFLPEILTVHGFQMKNSTKVRSPDGHHPT